MLQPLWKFDSERTYCKILQLATFQAEKTNRTFSIKIYKFSNMTKQATHMTWGYVLAKMYRMQLILQWY